MEQLKNSTAYAVFNNFEKISQIPRCSHDEERISKFIYEFGKNLGYESIRDEFGNVIIRRPATKGYENREILTFQAHLDMVCEKTYDSVHDFTCDPIELIINGDFIHANKTTLGADDGAGVALLMTLLEDKSIEGPEIEALFTTTEETGMDGALGLGKDILKGKKLINLDNEEDFRIFVGCAGGVDAILTSNIERVQISNLENYEIKVFGLQGGHSGSMINEPRLNANKVLDLLLSKLKNDLDIKLIDFNGGSKRNAIPSHASAKIGVCRDSIEKFNEVFDEIIHEIKDQNLKRELDLDFSLEKLNENYDYIEDDKANKIVRLLQLFPHGVNTMDKELDVVKSLNNLAIVNISKDEIKLITSIRSSDEDDLEYLKNLVLDLGKSMDFEVKFSDGYPMWKPKFDSVLLNRAKEIYKKIKNEDVEVAVIHAGLETGIISEKYPDMQIISIGPNITGAHTPNERLQISSVEFVFEYLKELLKDL